MNRSIKKIEYPCPSCGNDLYENNKFLFKCPYCQTIIITQDKKSRREAEIYHPNFDGKRQGTAKII